MIPFAYLLINNVLPILLCTGEMTFKKEQRISKNSSVFFWVDNKLYLNEEEPFWQNIWSNFFDNLVLTQVSYSQGHNRMRVLHLGKNIWAISCLAPQTLKEFTIVADIWSWPEAKDPLVAMLCFASSRFYIYTVCYKDTWYLQAAWALLTRPMWSWECFKPHVVLENLRWGISGHNSHLLGLHIT